MKHTRQMIFTTMETTFQIVRILAETIRPLNLISSSMSKGLVCPQTNSQSLACDPAKME